MPDSATSLRALLERIEQLGGAEAAPVVSLDGFFEGNDDEASIGPNLDPHPGIDTFSRVLREIDDRDSVAHVVVQISEVMSEDEWPFSGSPDGTLAWCASSGTEKARLRAPPSRSESPEVPASPARIGRSRGTWEGVLSAASFRT